MLKVATLYLSSNPVFESLFNLPLNNSLKAILNASDFTNYIKTQHSYSRPLDTGSYNIVLGCAYDSKFYVVMRPGESGCYSRERLLVNLYLHFIVLLTNDAPAIPLSLPTLNHIGEPSDAPFLNHLHPPSKYL